MSKNKKLKLKLKLKLSFKGNLNNNSQNNFKTCNLIKTIDIWDKPWEECNIDLIKGNDFFDEVDYTPKTRRLDYTRNDMFYYTKKDFDVKLDFPQNFKEDLGWQCDAPRSRFSSHQKNLISKVIKFLETNGWENKTEKEE